MDTSQLRQQQITLGLLKAARVLCSRQDNLRQILSHQASSSDGSSTFSLQHLMCSAIKPSPIKALFDREELEVLNIFFIIRASHTLYAWKMLDFRIRVAYTIMNFELIPSLVLNVKKAIDQIK